MRLIVQSHFDTLLRYVLSVTFCGVVVMKVMDQKTLVTRRWSYKVRRTVYILILSEFVRHEFTNLWLETFSWTLSDNLSLSDRNKTRPKTSKTSEWLSGYNSLSLAERWTITEIRRPSNSVLTYSLLTDALPLYRVSQRNPSGYWQVTKGDLSQIISSLHDSFLFRSSFFIRF